MNFTSAHRRFFLNKYAIVVYLFIVWMVFFDRHNVRAQYELSQRVEHMEEQKKTYETQIAETALKQEQIKSDKERFARETYLMHKENEDVFIIAEPKQD